jgi:glycosyltransferase involved in cell wall biosynthesis
VSGGHSNAIRSFISCQRAKGINAVALSPMSDAATAETSWEFPVAEIDSLWNLRWATIAERLQLASGNSLLHLHSVNRRYTPLLQEVRRAGVPDVLTSHGQLGFQTPWRWLKKFIYLNVVNRGPIRAAGLHFLSRFAARRVNYLLMGYRGPRMIQGNLVTVPDLSGLAPASRSEYHIPQDAFVLVFLGRLDVRVKGLDLLVEAFACLPPDRFRLVLIGPDWKHGRAQLEQQATQLGCRDRIQFLGPLYGERKWSILQMADAFVSPSRREAFGIAQVEAMATGLPVIASTAASLAPELREADAALLAPPRAESLAKAIVMIAADAERRHALGRRGKAWMQANCDPDRAGIRFQEFYDLVLRKAQDA